MNFNLVRPSTLARVIEDTVFNGFGHLNHTRHSFQRAVEVEYAARSIVASKRNLDKINAAYAALSPAEQKQAARDMKLIERRVAELLCK